MTAPSDPRRDAAEARARVLIDAQLAQAGWVVQDKNDLNLMAGRGAAVREVVMKPGHGRTEGRSATIANAVVPSPAVDEQRRALGIIVETRNRYQPSRGGAACR